MDKKILAAVLMVSVFALAGCETGKGLGRDMENTGQNIQDGINKNQ